MVLTYRGTLGNPQIFPRDYAALMVPLIRAMIAYFDGDVDVVMTGKRPLRRAWPGSMPS